MHRPSAGQLKMNLTLTNIFLLFSTINHVEALIKTMGGGESITFTGTATAETQEIRTPVFDGFESFTISMWIKNVSPGSNLFGTDVGYPGTLWSYWLLSDGPSVGSGWTEKRATGRDVFQNFPLFSVYIFGDVESILKHNDVALTMGSIPNADGWLQDTYIHYLFTYDGPGREINKYADASFCFNQGECDSAVERTSDNVADVEYLQSLNSTRVEPGMFRFGQSDPGEPTLTMDLDDICIFNKSMSMEEAASIMDFGCDSVSGLVLNYNFNQRRTQSPDLYDTVSGTYNGISRNYLDMGNATPAECGANTESVDTCEAIMVPPNYKGKLTDRLQLDFGGDIGPVISNQGGRFSLTGKLNILRSAQYESEHIVTVQPVCIGQCRRFVIMNMPSEGELCWDSPKVTGNWTCDPDRVIVNGSVLSLEPGHDDPDLADWVDRSAIPIYYLPHGNSTAGVRDTFNLVAESLQSNGFLAINDTFESANLLIQIITNTPPIAGDYSIEIAEGGFNPYFFPIHSEFLTDPDGGRENIEAEIVRIEINRTSSNPPVLLVYECPDCEWDDDGLELGSLVDVEQGNNLTSTIPSHRVNDPLRRVFLQHVDGSGSGVGLVTIVYRLFDQFDYSTDARVTLNIVGRNKPPVVLSGFVNTLEDSGDVLVELRNLTTDIEGDIPLWRIDEFPKHGMLYQLNSDASKGDKIRAKSSSEPVQQWIDGSMPCTSSSAWLGYDCHAIDGPPDVYPLAGDDYGTFSPDFDWTGEPVSLVLFLSEPVYLAELAFYFTWGPGAVVSIETKPFGDARDSWEVVYKGSNTMSAHCIGDPVTMPCADINRYRLCPKSYMTNTFRVVMTVDLADRWIQLDTVLSQGTKLNDAVIVAHPDGKLIWTPDADFHGNDTFKFMADDCPSFLVLQMPPLDRLDTQQAEFTNVVSAVNDAPVVGVDGSTTLGTDKTVFYEIPISILDVDNAASDLSFTINSLPEFGTLWIDEWLAELSSDMFTDSSTQFNGTTASPRTRKGAPILVELSSSIDFTRQMLLFQASQCTDADLMPLVEFQVTVLDTSGASSAAVLKFNTDCTNLPQTWEVDRPSGISVAFGMFASLFGLAMVAFSIAFNLRFRKHGAVRMSSYRINIILFLGCSFIYISLLSMSVTHLFPSCFQEGRVDTQANKTAELSTLDSCTHFECFSDIWLLDIGAALAWGSLYAKTYRIHYLFAASRVRKRPFADIHIAKAVAKLVLLVVLALLALCLYIGTPSLIFTPGTTQLSATDNVKLVTVVAYCSGGFSYDLLIYLSVGGFTILQLFSAQIAYSVRNIELKQVNDSQQIAFAIYTSLMIGLPGLGVASVVPSSDLSFVIITFSIFLATTVVLLSMLLPRMHDVYNSKVDVLFFEGASNVGGTSQMQVTQMGVDEQITNLRLEVNELRKQLGLSSKLYSSSMEKQSTTWTKSQAVSGITDIRSQYYFIESEVSTFGGTHYSNSNVMFTPVEDIHGDGTIERGEEEEQQGEEEQQKANKNKRKFGLF